MYTVHKRYPWIVSIGSVLIFLLVALVGTPIGNRIESLAGLPVNSGILIQQVMCRAYRERLSYYMQDPTTHTSIVMQLTDMVKKAEEQYASQVAAAQQKYSNSKPLPSQSVDKFDRVY